MEELGLHNLKPARGSKITRKRLGRGNASGKGNYSGKGMKGQRARSGGKAGLVQFGVKNYLLRIPKNRGFTSLRIRMAEVNLRTLNKFFQTNETVTASALVKKGLIATGKFGLKILGAGELKNKLTVQANAFSASAKEAIEKAGGRVELLPRPGVPVKKTPVEVVPVTETIK